MNGRTLVPPLKMQGIKTKLVPFIREHVRLPEGAAWFEPFMGSGAVGFNVAPRNAVFADVNPHVIAFYNAVKDGTVTPDRTRAFLEREGRKLEEGDEDYYREVRDRFNAGHDPLDFLFLNRACFNGLMRFNRKREFNVPYGHKPRRFSRAYVTKIVNQLRRVRGLMAASSWTFLCQPFEKTIACAGERDFIYCDPPYIGRHVDYYDSWNEEQERRLHACLQASGARFMLSTWDHTEFRKNEYADSVWRGCNKITKSHFYYVGGRESNRKPVVEALLVNYQING